MVIAALDSFGRVTQLAHRLRDRFRERNIPECNATRMIMPAMSAAVILQKFHRFKRLVFFELYDNRGRADIEL
jgi:hypothetical protein